MGVGPEVKFERHRHFSKILSGVDLGLVKATALSRGQSDHRGGLDDIAAKMGRKDIEIVMHPVAFRQNRYAYNKQG